MNRSKDVQGKSGPDEQAQLEKLARKQKAMFENPLPDHLFSLQEMHEARSGNLLREMFKAIPEEEILEALPPARRSVSRRGRKPFPRRAKLRAVIARFELQLPSYAALAKRLRQDLQVKYECGFDMARSTPGEDCLEGFAQLLGKHLQGLQEAHTTLVDELSFLLPGLGENTSWDSSHLPMVKPPGEDSSPATNEDSKTPRGDNSETPLLKSLKTPSASSSCPRPSPPSPGADEGPENESKNSSGTSAAGESGQAPQGQREGAAGKDRESSTGNEVDNAPQSQKAKWPEVLEAMVNAKENTLPPLQADWGKKEYETVSEKDIQLSNGETVKGIEVKKTVSNLYGGKMHVIGDNTYKLPLKVEVTPQSQGDCPMIVPMYRDFCEAHGCIDIRYAMIDKAGDSGEVHRALLDEMGIVPIIPLREIPNKQAPADPGYEFAKTVYDRDRYSHVIDPRTGKYEEFQFWGYDKNRQALKYRCPCERMKKEGRLGAEENCPFYGAQCGGSRGEFPFSFWVSLKDNHRYYCPVPRETKRWEELYKQRTSIERINSVKKGPLQLGDKRLRSLTTASAEALLSAIFLCARAKVAIDWGALEKVGSATSHIPYRRKQLIA